MQDSYKTDWGVRYEAYTQSREYEVSENLNALKSTFSIFQKNFSELINWLEPLEDPTESLLRYNQDNMENVSALIAETNRLFHNFLASVKSLIDHTRVIVKRLYSEHEFMKEYEIKLKKDLAKNSLQLFVQRLRNYTQHYTLPILALEISFMEDATFNMKMDVKALKEWDGWDSAKTYLNALQGDLYIATLAKEYYVLIENFYSWLNKRQEEIHKLDFENLSKMQQELYG